MNFIPHTIIGTKVHRFFALTLVLKTESEMALLGRQNGIQLTSWEGLSTISDRESKVISAAT